jgi:CBS domain-containing protein
MKQIAELIGRRPLIHADSSDNVRKVAQNMSEKNVGAVAVLDSGKLVGIFSERDLMTRVVARGLNPEKTSVQDVMTRSLVVADPVDDLDSALQKMTSIGCRHLPVVDGGNLVGMISLRDLLMVDDQTNRDKASFLSELVTYSPDYES